MFSWYMGLSRVFKKTIAGLLIFAFFNAFPAPALAVEYVTVSGAINAPSGFTLQAGSVVVDGQPLVSTTNANGVYSVTVPKNQQVNFVFVAQIYRTAETLANSVATISNWATTKVFTGPTVLNFDLPEPRQISLDFRDASNGTVSKVKFNVSGFNPNHSDYIDTSGSSWSGVQRFEENKTFNGGYTYTTTGAVNVWLFDTSKFDGFLYIEQEGVPGNYVESGFFSISGNRNLKLCFPVRFGPSMSLPNDCFPTKQQQLAQISNSTPSPSPSLSVSPTPSPTPSIRPTPSPTPSMSPTFTVPPQAQSLQIQDLAIRRPSIAVSGQTVQLKWPEVILSGSFEAAYQYRITSANSERFSQWRNLVFENSLKISKLTKLANYKISLRPIVGNKVGRTSTFSFKTK